ncbi:MAG: LacI family DNA-binding transcriptional regulator [Candidatus Izemoplasmatales bacterium]|nr:LacI family DNA-binding transcriptional regulator [Candidatus Izemoplasmatales bacterium]
MVTIKDVAKRAGVGIATISRVINNTGSVKPATKVRVQKIIDEMGYQPNDIARQMLKQKSNIVAFVQPNNTHFFFSELLYEIEKLLYEDNVKVMVCNSSEELEKEIEFINMLQLNRVDALILLTNNEIQDKVKPGMPIVSFDRRFDGIPFVASDNYSGGIMAADELYKNGCRNMLFIGDDAQGEHSNIQTEVSKRRIGFVDRCKELRVNEVLTYEYPLGDYLISPNRVKQIIKDNPQTDGIFAISDAVALAVIKELEKNGKKVPEDVKVIGFDGGRSFLNLGKRISSIGQSPKLIGKAIRDAVIKQINNQKVNDIILPVYFSKGETV